VSAEQRRQKQKVFKNQKPKRAKKSKLPKKSITDPIVRENLRRTQELALREVPAHEHGIRAVADLTFQVKDTSKRVNDVFFVIESIDYRQSLVTQLEDVQSELQAEIEKIKRRINNGNA
jgi:hypothetical protein